MSTPETNLPKKAEPKPGFSKPIDPPSSGKIPEHIHEETLMAKGVDPDTKERVSVNMAALKAEFGEKKAREIYHKAAKLGGYLDPNMEPAGSDYFPDLDLSGMDTATRAKVDALLN